MTLRAFTTLALLALLAATTGCVSVVAKTWDVQRNTNLVRERTTLLNVHTDRGAIIRLYETGSSDKIPLRVLQVHARNSNIVAVPHNPYPQTPEVQNP